MSPAYLHKVLTKRCGNTWEVEFNIKKFGIYEKIKIPIPRLLTESTIQAIQKKCEARRTYEHAGYKYQYMLNRMVYDETGYALTGTSVRKGNRYYKTYRGRHGQYMVNADILEETIMDTLFEALGSNDALFAAVFEGNPGMKNAEDFKNKIALLKKERGRVEKQIYNISESVTNFSGEGLKFFIEEQFSSLVSLEKKLSDLNFKIDVMENQQQISPTKKEIKSSREKIHRDIARVTESMNFKGGGGFQDMSFEDKQKIIKMVFAGKDEESVMGFI